MTTEAVAKATVRFAILDALISNMPKSSYPYLQQAAKVAAEALCAPEFRWALETLSKKPD